MIFFRYPKLQHNRIPVCNSAAPLEADFDTICTALLGTNVNCPVIVNCQASCDLIIEQYSTLVSIVAFVASFEKYNELKEKS